MRIRTLLFRSAIASTLTLGAVGLVTAAPAQAEIVVNPPTANNSVDPGTNIVGGGTVEEDKPWIAALHKGNNFTCTATQISDEWIITAAHCVEDGGNFSVRIGSLDRTNGGTIRAIDEVHMHPDFDWPKFDIALLHMSQAFENTYPEIAKTEDLSLGQATTIYGWGSENADWSGPLPDHLKFSTGETSEESCTTDGVICIVGDGGVAGGDSGGPAFARSAQSDSDVLVGVCAIGHKPTQGRWSGYTSIPNNTDWIHQVSGVRPIQIS